MWNYEKRLEYPINIKQTNPALAAMIISQYGGPDGELGLQCVIFRNVTPCPTVLWRDFLQILEQKNSLTLR